MGPKPTQVCHDQTTEVDCQDQSEDGHLTEEVDECELDSNTEDHMEVDEDCDNNYMEVVKEYEVEAIVGERKSREVCQLVMISAECLVLSMW